MSHDDHDQFDEAFARLQRGRAAFRASGRRTTTELAPWVVSPEHLQSHDWLMLQCAIREFDGARMPVDLAGHYLAWIGDRLTSNTVVAYDPALGFTHVPARPDEDYIRHPDTE